MTEQNRNVPAPRHAYELRITIGACTWEYARRAARDIAEYIGERSPEHVGLASGGWDGSHSIDLQCRSIEPDAYRAELEEWRQATAGMAEPGSARCEALAVSRVILSKSQDRDNALRELAKAENRHSRLVLAAIDSGSDEHWDLANEAAVELERLKAAIAEQWPEDNCKSCNAPLRPNGGIYCAVCALF